jgi:hypothetical protein
MIPPKLYQTDFQSIKHEVYGVIVIEAGVKLTPSTVPYTVSVYVTPDVTLVVPDRIR